MKRSKFSLSHYQLMSMNMGKLVPCQIQEVLPGDTFQASSSVFLRFSPMVAPIMHPVHVRVHHWFVPTRLVWEHWDEFITGDDTYSVPQVALTAANTPVGSLYDYFGIPTVHASGLSINSLPFRAYNKIYNEWYRDQDLVTAIPERVTDTGDLAADFELRSPPWEKDFFTTARPWEQKGDAVMVPLGTSAPIGLSGSNATGKIRRASDGALQAAGVDTLQANNGTFEGASGTDFFYDPNGTLTADLSTATGATVNDMRRAFALQRYQEARARYGSRYTEYLAYLGVRADDARLQRPEYLGGGKQTVQFSEVLQTAEGTAPVGSMKGHGVGMVKTNRFRKFFSEHGYVISLISVQPTTVYTQGVRKGYLKRTMEEYWQRELEHIGQAAINPHEVYANQAYNAAAVFGYQDRYDEYRRCESGVSGEFRTTLNYWHAGREFAAPPTLNGDFVTANPTNRMFASSATHQMYVMVYHNVQARRMISRRGTSSIL